MIKALQQFVHPSAIEPLEDLIAKYHFNLKITRGRKTKRGDFRATTPLPIITINNDLNQDQFLITLVHEIAHLHVFNHYKNVKPHGIEWKTAFKNLMLPFLNDVIFTNDILSPLAQYLINPKASSDNDRRLSLALSEKYNTHHIDKSYIFDLPTLSKFEFQNRKFQILHKRRTRYECIDTKNKLKYLINGNALVTPVKD